MNICSEAVIDSIRQGVSNIPPESGGILGGRNDVVTNICLDKGILGKHPCSYTPDTRFLNQKINQWAETGIQFMGMFHVHFGGTESLSEGDKEYIVGNCSDCVYADRSDWRDGEVYCLCEKGWTHGYNRPSDRNGCAYYEER